MVINLYVNGQLGNRLLHISSFIVNSAVYDYKFYYLSFPSAYHEYFNIHDNHALKQTKARFRFSKLPAINAIMIAGAQALLYLCRRVQKLPYLDHLTIVRPAQVNQGVYYDLNDTRYIEKARKKLLFVEGWRFTDPDNMSKHLPLIREIFAPREKYAHVIHTIVQKARNFGEVLVGVHIRRGDYKHYQSGKWYYDNAVYSSFMRDMQKVLMEGYGYDSIVFIICSDEVIDVKQFHALPVVYIRKSEIIDLYTLSNCDYILAPPSTFSGWASYYGNVPIYYIDDPSMPFDEDQLTTGLHPHFTSAATHCRNYYDVLNQQ